MTWSKIDTGFLDRQAPLDCCPLCGHGRGIRWIETGSLGWCQYHSVLLCKDPSKLSSMCDSRGCGDAAEFVTTSVWCNQYSCRAHVGAAGGPHNVYGLTDRAIGAAEKWKGKA